MAFVVGAYARSNSALLRQDDFTDLCTALQAGPTDCFAFASTPRLQLAWIGLEGSVGSPAQLADCSLSLACGSLYQDGHDAAANHRLLRDEAAKETPSLGDISGDFGFASYDVAADTLHLLTDKLGVRALFVYCGEDRVWFSSSLRVMERLPGVRKVMDLRALTEMAFFGWPLGDRTPYLDIRVLRPGERLRVDASRVRADYYWRWNTLPAWRGSREDCVADLATRFRTAIRRRSGADRRVFSLLSGGLDSRMVAGAAAARGKQLVGLTFGDLRSDEVKIAGRVAQTTGATWLPSGLDADFAFERLAFDRVNRTHETMYNLMWDANAPLLAAEGVTHFSTGATFETIFGGWKDADKRRRFLRNMRQSVLGAWKVPAADAAERAAVAEAIKGIGRKRARHYAALLAEPYRSLVTGSLPAAEREVDERVALIAAAGPITAAQIRERFDSEHYQTHYSRNQERQLFAYGTVVLPTIDRDLANYLTNLPAGMKYDHALYYKVIRRLYPDLAAIPVPNLGTGVDKSQLRIELNRVYQIQRKQRLTTWVNFSDWMRLGDNMTKYERLFLEQPHFFDGDAIRAFFGDVRAGRRSIYDGGETTGFLNLAYLLDERRLEL